jgi:hypothetical protein
MSESLPPSTCGDSGGSGRSCGDRLGSLVCQTLAILFAIPVVAVLVACALQGLTDPDVPYSLAHRIFGLQEGAVQQPVPFIIFYRYALFITTLMASGQILAAVRRTCEDCRV